jgi:hypothetical protein
MTNSSQSKLIEVFEEYQYVVSMGWINIHKI